MARNKTLSVFIGFNTLFLLSAGLHLFIPLYTRASHSQPPNLTSVANNLLLDECPLNASIVNSALMFLTFAISLPALFRPRNLILLQIHAILITLCATFTLALGLQIWFSTLETRRNLEPIWEKQSVFIQSMLQFKFKCCGYLPNDERFVLDGTCPNIAEVARHSGCAAPFGIFANKFLDVVFTTFFGFVALDMLVLLSVLSVIKERREAARYAFIDEKRKFGNI